jgi:hypothetical protein
MANTPCAGRFPELHKFDLTAPLTSISARAKEVIPQTSSTGRNGPKVTLDPITRLPRSAVANSLLGTTRPSALAVPRNQPHDAIAS